MLSTKKLKYLKYTENISLLGVLVTIGFFIWLGKNGSKDLLDLAGACFFTFMGTYILLYYGVRGWHYGYAHFLTAFFPKIMKERPINDRFTKVCSVVLMTVGAVMSVLGIASLLHLLIVAALSVFK
jgi:hypothetical protein